MIHPVLVMSCAHYGKKTHSYGIPVLERRFEYLTDRLVTTCQSLREVKTLTIVNLGDNCDGSLIYPTQAFHQDEVDPLSQVDPMLNIFLGLSRTVYEECDVRVEWQCVPGNHGRTTVAPESTNWDVLLYRLLQREAREKDWLIVDTGSTDDGDLFLRRFMIEGAYCLSYHGSSIRSYAGFPRYGIANRVTKWLMTPALKPCRYVFIGHFHCCEYFTVNEKEIYVTGTMVSGDEWALETLGYESLPSWWLLFFEEGRVQAAQKLDLTGAD